MSLGAPDRRVWVHLGPFPVFLTIPSTADTMLPSASMAGRGLRALVLAMGVEMGAAVTQSKASPTPLPAVNRRDFVTALGAAGCMVSYEAAPLLHDGMEQAMGGPTCEGMEELARAASVFCNGPLLDAVQRAGVFADCKVFVDSPLKVEPEEVLRRFSLLPHDASKAELRTFVLENFDRPGTDLVPWAPVDYTDRPPALARLQNAELSEWAHSLNSFWAQLGRATSVEVAESPHRRTLLPLPHPFVVPGGRFVETYYWGARRYLPLPVAHEKTRMHETHTHACAAAAHVHALPPLTTCTRARRSQIRTGSSRACSRATCATRRAEWCRTCSTSCAPTASSQTAAGCTT